MQFLVFQPGPQYSVHILFQTGPSGKSQPPSMGQRGILQVAVWEAGPEQGAPLFEGGVQVLVLVVVSDPSPQTGQALQGPQADQTPSVGQSGSLMIDTALCQPKLPLNQYVLQLEEES